MSTSLIALLLVLLQSYHTTAAITCDQELVMKRPISCRRSLPCNYMLPVIPEDFPKEWSLEEQADKGGICDCINHVCQQSTVVVQTQLIHNVSCLPAVCFPQSDPVVTCSTVQYCKLSYPSVPLKYANDWASDSQCSCVEGVCQAVVSVGLDYQNVSKLLVPCRGIQL